MKHKQTRRLFALLLVFALVIGLLPSVLADNEASTAESAEETLAESQPFHRRHNPYWNRMRPQRIPR